MPYKIVQTLERGKLRLGIVPSSWEDKGNLWWPPKKILEKSIRDDQSKPTKDWKLMNCILKRNNIPTYQQADNELSIMEQNSDTDVQDNVAAADHPCETVTYADQDEINFEILANNLSHDQGNTENVVEVYSAEINVDQVLANQKIISEKIDAIIAIQNIMLENQKKLTHTLAALSVQIEDLTQKNVSSRDPLKNVTLLKDCNRSDNDCFSLKTVKTESDLKELEQILGDNDFKTNLKKQLSFVCSASKGDGITCAYKLLDLMFDRNFLCQCSWTGSSRAETSKIPLKDYKNVLNLFFTMVHSWDSDYTIQRNETFFKMITKNAKQRLSMKNLRMSSKRQRINKNNKTIKRQKQNEENERPETEETEHENIAEEIVECADESDEGLC